MDPKTKSVETQLKKQMGNPKKWAVACYPLPTRIVSKLKLVIPVAVGLTVRVSVTCVVAPGLIGWLL